MSNLILNVRFGLRHLQVVRFGDWLPMLLAGRSPVTFRRNPGQVLMREQLGPQWRWFEWYL